MFFLLILINEGNNKSFINNKQLFQNLFTMDRGTVEFTRITSTDSLDEHYLKVTTKPKEVTLAVCEEEPTEEEKPVNTNYFFRIF